MAAGTVPGQEKGLIPRSRQLPAGETIGRKAEESQIKVYSKFPIIRTQFDVYSRNLRDRFRNLLGRYDDDDWKIPLEVYLYGNGNEVHSGAEFITEGFLNAADRFTLRLKVKVHDRFEEESYRIAFVRLLLLEQMLEVYSEDPGEFQTAEIKVPDWLVHGFDQTIHHRELGMPSYFYSGFVKSGQFLKVGEIVSPNRARGLNRMSLELFRASSSVLVSALCGQKGGRESMRGLLGDLAINPGANAETLIRKHFPGLRETGRGIEKWWALQLAHLGQKQSFEYFTPEETEKHLDECLEVAFAASEIPASEINRGTLLGKVRSKFGKEETVQLPAFRGTVADFEQFVKRPGAREMMLSRISALIALKVRAFPLHRQIIDKYIFLCEQIVSGETRNVPRQLAELGQTRERIAESLQQTRDYLNFYEATRSPKRSRAFDSFLQFREEVEKGALLPKRADPISETMDRIERQSHLLGPAPR